MQNNKIIFNNYGFIHAKFSDSDLAPLKTEINSIQNNFELYESQSAVKDLVGSIEREYRLVESKDYVENLFLPLVYEYEHTFDYFMNFSILNKHVPIVLDTCWVNFQKKYEYNPPHNHGGFLSFVLWINVPYDMEEERRVAPGAAAKSNSAGMFSFLFSNTIGKIQPFHIPIDKNMENNMIIFPSNFYHTVYPFYSSDGYRISVSGNFKFKVD
jgi:hypothetical protein